MYKKFFIIYTSMVSLTYGNIGLEIKNMANKYIGNPYIYGGNSLTKGIDCSAFVKVIMKSKSGINLPRTAKNQALKTELCSNINTLTGVQIGDALYFKNKKEGIHHVALVTGFNHRGKPIITHAKGKKYGIVRELMSEKYHQEFFVAKRFSSCNNDNKKMYKALLVKNL
ncbi:MAG: NlpC/P60 family protein [Sulfurovum sp.]|nr:NlpC/P60 family protein [Sulfurovum sp.]